MAKPAYLIDNRFRLHDPGSHHPESPDRLIYIQQALDESGAANRWLRIQPRPARLEEIEMVHSPGHIVSVRRAAQQAPSFLDLDTLVCEMSYDIALLAAGSVLACTDAVMGGEADRVFAFVRPPGHHAEPSRAMGFCLFNNAALAAAHLRLAHGLERVAIIDFDLHHGNGTQACFYHDPGVLYISTHQYPFYPGTGDFSEVGSGEGRGYTVNFPLPAGAGDGVFVPIYSRLVSAILDQYAPEFIVVSAGFDAFRDDPLGGLAVSVAGFASVTASLIRAADRCCAGRICFVLEGGYSPAGLKQCTQAMLTEMASDNPKERSVPADAFFDIISRRVAGKVGEHWKW